MDLIKDLQNLDVEILPISTYYKGYLNRYIMDIHSAMNRFQWIIDRALRRVDEKPEELTFLEYGGGTGMLSLLARDMGFKTVIYDDTNPLACRAAIEIGHALNRRADWYIQGSILEVIKFCQDLDMKFDIIVSNDAIEHTRNIELFLDHLKYISRNGTSMVHATGANPLFYPIAKPAEDYKEKTGAWGEHLMNPNYLVDVLSMNGFDAGCFPLPPEYLKFSNGLRRILGYSLGVMSRLDPMHFSPGYAIITIYDGVPRRIYPMNYKYDYRRSPIWWYIMLPVWKMLYILYNSKKIKEKIVEKYYDWLYLGK